MAADLPEQAIGELTYEIDSEIVNMLVEGAELDDKLKWSKTIPVGVSKMEHYAGFGEIVEIAKAILYRRTQKFAPNYMIVDSMVMPILSMVPGFKAANVSKINGPYLAGTLNGLKIFVSPLLQGELNDDGYFFVLGVNGNDLQSSAGVYAPYMPIVPTQLLGFADGGMSQGFSTLYDAKLLSTYENNNHEYSRLLVCGKVIN